MGIELPLELADVAARTGVRWPEADEDAMREQARAWRDAATQINTLAGDADASASAAFDGMSGDGATAARREWSGIVDADSGELGRAARGATDAADRLEHAANRIAETKVELVRQLTEVARQVDAANAAADGGHPGALAGVPTLLSSASANLATTADSLVGAVAEPARGAAEPGHGAADVVAGASADAGRALGHSPGIPGDGGPFAAGDAARAVPDAAESIASTPDELRPGGGVPAEVPGNGPGAGLDDVVPGMGSGAGFDDVSPTAPTPPSGIPAAAAGYADAPTPPSGNPAGAGPYGAGPHGSYAGGQPPIDGSTGLAGYAGAPAAPPPAPTVPPPGPIPGSPAAGAGMGAFGGGPVAAPPHGGVAGHPPAHPGHGGQQAAQQRPAPAPQPPANQQPSQRPAPQPPSPDRAAPQPSPDRQASPQSQSGTTGSPRQDRDSVVALFLVHMFPIGHLPVPASAPAYQLPLRPDEADFAAGLRFPPHDHPESNRIDPGDPPSGGDGADQAVRGLPADHPAVATLCGEDDPVRADMQGWQRRYAVTRDRDRVEYAWPPGELYPEGCGEDGEPVVLPAGTMLDRFGGEHGRVFAADRTPYAARSLPPAHVDRGYHRYRVLRDVPMWRGETASWFGQPGGGVRYRAVYPVHDLVALGYLTEITPDAEAETAEAVETAQPTVAADAPEIAPAAPETGDNA